MPAGVRHGCVRALKLAFSVAIPLVLTTSTSAFAASTLTLNPSGHLVYTESPGVSVQLIVVNDGVNHIFNTQGTVDINADAVPACNDSDPTLVDCPLATGGGVMHFILDDGQDQLTLMPGVVATTDIDGGPGDDQIEGGSGDDGINGGAGIDAINGNVGSDSVDGGPGVEGDVLIGGDGFDTCDYQDRTASLTVTTAGGADDGESGEGDDCQAEQVYGGSGADTITGDGGDNNLLGYDGQDTLRGGLGSDYLDGTDVSTAARDVLDGQGGPDTLQGGNSTDVCDYSDRTNPVIVTLDLNADDGEAGEGDFCLANSVDGSQAGDTLTGSDFSDVLRGNQGVDTLTGGLGGDRLDGGTGADTLDGGAGLSDTCDYTTRTTTVIVDLGVASGDGEAGENDNCVNVERVLSGSGNDTVTGSAADNLLSSGPGSDSVSGLTGGDVLDGGTGPDVMDGGADIDNCTYSGRTAAVDVSLDGVANDGEAAENDNCQNAENANGGLGNDTLTGDSGANSLFGDGGGDTLFGRENGDTLNGGPGSNIGDGGPGSDTIFGDGARACDYTARTNAVNVTLDLGANDGELGENDNCMGAGVAGGSANDELTGGPPFFFVTLSGGPGDDLMRGIDGAWETMIGGSGDDVCDYSQRVAPITVTLDGAANDGDPAIAEEDNCQADGVLGGPEADTLTGGAGNDTVDGGPQTDAIAGGGGIDTCSYASHSTAVIADLDNIADDGTVGENENCGPTFENLTGGSAGDNLTGDGGPNVLDGGLGADTLTGGAGSDTCAYAARTVAVSVTLDAAANDGEPGESDTCVAEGVSGGSGNDTITGDANDNPLSGGVGVDALAGAAGIDALSGGPGNDSLDGGPSADSMDGGADTDTCTYATRTAAVGVSLDGIANDGEAAENDNCQNAENATGGPGNDTLAGDGGANVLNGGGGSDTCDYSQRFAAVTVTLDGAANDGGPGENDNCLAMENASGGGGNDSLSGDGLVNSLTGGGGADTLVGGLLGDTLDGGAGASDTCDYSGRSGTVNVTLDGAGNDGGTAENDNCQNAENVLGGSGDDTLAGDAQTNVLDGGAGIDTCDYSSRGAALTLTLDGAANDGAAGEGDNCLAAENLTGGTGADGLTGNAVANTLSGNGGGDTINGAAGADAIDGAAGNDILTGGSGGDTIANGTDSNTVLARDGELDSISCTGGGAADTITSDFGSPLDALSGCGAARVNDADNDGVPEPADACPMVPAPGQANGCPAAQPPPPPPPTDGTAPATTKGKGPKSKIKSKTASFVFTSEAGARFECSLDRKTYAACTSPAKAKRLKPGKHTFEVRATDQAGNVDPTPAKWSFKVVPR